MSGKESKLIEYPNRINPIPHNNIPNPIALEYEFVLSAILVTSGDVTADTPKNIPPNIPTKNFEIPKYSIKKVKDTGKNQELPSFMKCDIEVNVSILYFIGYSNLSIPKKFIYLVKLLIVHILNVRYLN